MRWGSIWGRRVVTSTVLWASAQCQVAFIAHPPTYPPAHPPRSTGTMPLENLVRRMQVQGRPGFPRQYASTMDCVQQMMRQEGLRSFWRGRSVEGNLQS